MRRKSERKYTRLGLGEVVFIDSFGSSCVVGTWTDRLGGVLIVRGKIAHSSNVELRKWPQVNDRCKSVTRVTLTCGSFYYKYYKFN